MNCRPGAWTWSFTDPIADAREVQHEYNLTLGTVDDLHPVDALIVAVGHNSYRALNARQLRSYCRHPLLCWQTSSRCMTATNWPMQGSPFTDSDPMKNFALIGAAGYIAPRHMRAIKDTGNRLKRRLRRERLGGHHRQPGA